jgi:hypothetical protein
VKKWMMFFVIGTLPAMAQTAPLPQTSPATFPATAATTLPTKPPTTLPATMAATMAATTAPSTGPTTSSSPTTTAAVDRLQAFRDRFQRPQQPPRTVGAAKPLPRDFNLLVSRSVFVHGPQRIFEGPEVPPTTQPGNSSFQPSRPERTLLFNGSTRTEGEWVAFIEDTVASRVLKLKVGEPIARGKVTAITLSSLNYDANGKSTLVAIGQNLDGESAAPSSTQPSLAGAPSTGPGGSQGGPGASPGLSGPANDMLERLRQKRLKELGGK